MDDVVREELALLAVVSRKLNETPYIAPPREDQIVAELVRLREEMPRAKEEDKGALMAQYDQNFNLLQQLRESRGEAQVDPDVPYFAHLRLREGGRKRDLCLGKATRIDGGLRIVDWRNAPVSRIFYSYQQGEEYEEEMGGRVVEGVVEARRTVVIHRATLERIDAPEGTFRLQEDGEWELARREPARLAGGQGAAMRAHQPGEGTERRLGTNLEGHRRRTDKRLPDIAGLIDPEQFELITRPTSGFVVVRGTAGSGKTTVTLHRIAWMAYEDSRINSKATLFLVFSRALKDYVSHVLPALGVPNVSVQSYFEWSRRLVTKHFPGLPRSHRDDTPEALVRLKLHPVCEQLLVRQNQRVDGPATWEQAADDVFSLFSSEESLSRDLAELAPGLLNPTEIRKITTWSRDRHDELIAWMDGEREVKPQLDAEDDTLLLRAFQHRVGRLRGRGRSPLVYRHLALDEVQDFTPMDVRVLLGTLDKNKSITLAGDTQQHITSHSGFTSWSAFLTKLGVDGTAVSTLRVSYRCSHQITSFAMELLGELREDETPPLTTRQGPEVELFRFTDHGGAVAFLADALKSLMRDEPLASVAVLTPGGDLSSTYYRGLDKGEVPRLRRVTNQDFTFAPGVEVTEIEQVKGLEFDYVVLVEVSANRYPDNARARRLLHVGATRAVHQLWMTTVGATSPIVREAMDTLGTDARAT